MYAYQLRSHEASHKRKQASEKDIVPSNEHREIVLGLSSDNQPGSEIIQTFYQCSLCQEMFDSYLSLEAHCAVHAGGEEGTVVLAVDESLHAENTITYLSNEGETNMLGFRLACQYTNINI